MKTLLLILLLAGCQTLTSQPGGFIALSAGACPLLGADGSAFQIAPTVAVTVNHGSILVPDDLILARDPERDILLFRHVGVPIPHGIAQRGAAVTVLGQRCGGRHVVSEGFVVTPEMYWNGGSAPYILVRAEVAAGNSGGPVLQGGRVVGMQVRRVDSVDYGIARAGDALVVPLADILELLTSGERE